MTPRWKRQTETIARLHALEQNVGRLGEAQYSEKTITLIETKRYPDAGSNAILHAVKIIYSGDLFV